jgi:hypothetical protein
MLTDVLSRLHLPPVCLCVAPKVVPVQLQWQWQPGKLIVCVYVCVGRSYVCHQKCVAYVSKEG